MRNLYLFFPIMQTTDIALLSAAAASRVNTKAKLPAHTAVKKLEAFNKDPVILLEQMHTIEFEKAYRNA